MWTRFCGKVPEPGLSDKARPGSWRFGIGAGHGTLRPLTLTGICALAAAPVFAEPGGKLTTLADARASPAVVTDLGEPGDSVGDLLTFDQPLLNEAGDPIGTNSGFCVRTRVAHSYQCQWTLTLEDGSIQVAGRELEEGASMIPIVGGTGAYAGASGQMRSVNNGDGTFTQTLHFAE